MIDDLKPCAECRESGLPQPGLFEGTEEISADILAIEKEAEGLLDGLLKRDREK
jgi:hypothetical protein